MKSLRDLRDFCGEVNKVQAPQELGFWETFLKTEMKNKIQFFGLFLLFFKERMLGEVFVSLVIYRCA